MSNDFLTQEEIDALLSRAVEIEADPLEEEDKDLLGEVGNICMGSAANTLSVIVNQPVSITTPKVRLTTLEKLSDEFEVPNVAIEVKFSKGLKGANLLVMKVPDAAIIADLMMGGNGIYKGGELTEIEMSAVSEAMNQMIGTAATSMATLFNREVNISPPTALLWDSKGKKLSESIDPDENIVLVSFKLAVGNLIDSEIMQLLSVDAAREIVEAMTAGFKESTPPVSDGAHQKSAVEQKVETENTMMKEVNVQKAQFMPFEEQAVEDKPRNIDLILDVPIEVSVILGRTEKTIKEVLELGNGSLIELDKLVEEPVEILVNGKMVAEGEVVVVNENFGVRITDIVNNVERVKKLQGK